MKYLNYEFFDEFKQLDKLCRDIYGKTSDNRLGVSSYIDDMEANSYRGELWVRGWRDDFYQLKKVRHKRNELAHDQVSFSDDVCTQADIDFVRSFRERILNKTDPISLLRRQATRTYSRSNTRPSPKSSSSASGCFLPVLCVSVSTIAVLVASVFLIFAII